MAKFKIGDRVVCVARASDDTVQIGWVGTVDDGEDSSCPGVMWDNNGHYHCMREDEMEYAIGEVPAQPVQQAKGDIGSAATKDTNPKDSVGIRKVPMSVVPAPVVMEIALGMLEGARKYGRSNYRVSGVRASVYYDATMRHLMDWWEGADVDPASGLSHVTKALSSLVVLRDAMMNDMCTDDRPPSSKNQQWVDDMNKKAGEIIDKYPDAVPPFLKVK